jgi:hypothetical protein
MGRESPKPSSESGVWSSEEVVAAGASTTFSKLPTPNSRLALPSPPALRSLCLALLLASGTSNAIDLDVHGYLDLRWVDPADTRGWTDGGLGKTRWGDGDDGLRFGGAALALGWQATPSLRAFVELQAQSDGDPRVDLTVATLRWRPVSTTPWRWTATAGVFFPPVSLENDGIGWTSRWTLSPSAINSWVGEELRATGAELRLEHRGAHGTLEFAGALFGRNEPAGELLASRGWAIGDVTTGYFGWLRQPDVYAPVARTDAPTGFEPFRSIDGAIGAYAQLEWSSPAYGEWTALRYDNRADPEAFAQLADRRLFAWHTRFTSLGAQHAFGDLRVVAQWMDGATSFEPREGLYLDSEFDSAFVLAAWERGAWRPALRVERFRVRQRGQDLDPLDEHGHAVTVAMNWRPTERWRFTAEWLRIRSTRAQRALEGEAVRMSESRMQVSARFLF